MAGFPVGPLRQGTTINFEPIAPMDGQGIFPGRHVHHYQGRRRAVYPGSLLGRGNRSRDEVGSVETHETVLDEWLMNSARRYRAKKTLDLAGEGVRLFRKRKVTTLLKDSELCTWNGSVTFDRRTRVPHSCRSAR